MSDAPPLFIVPVIDVNRPWVRTIVSRVEIGPALVDKLRGVSLGFLLSKAGVYYYELTVASGPGCTAKEFVEVVAAYACEDFERANKVIVAINERIRRARAA